MISSRFITVGTLVKKPSLKLKLCKASMHVKCMVSAKKVLQNITFIHSYEILPSTSTSPLFKLMYLSGHS